jgi:hypothetical protein
MLKSKGTAYCHRRQVHETGLLVASTRRPRTCVSARLLANDSPFMLRGSNRVHASSSRFIFRRDSGGLGYSFSARIVQVTPLTLGSRT